MIDIRNTRNYWSLGNKLPSRKKIDLNNRRKIDMEEDELVGIDMSDGDEDNQHFDSDCDLISEISNSNDKYLIFQLSIDNTQLTDVYLTGSVIETECNFHLSLEDSQEPLFNGSKKTVSELLLILEFVKTSNHLGDITQSLILGILGSFLPSDNAVSKYLSATSSTIYHYQKYIKLLSESHYTCSVHKVPICSKGCIAFVGCQRLQRMCPTCGLSRMDPKLNTNWIYYLPLKERLMLLLISDMKNLFHYPILRSQTNKHFYEDIYDGSTWKLFEDQMDVNKNERLLGLQYCWDGADAFNFSGKSFWPGCVSIINFPKDLRSKLHIGMHVVTLCEGLYHFYYVFTLLLL